MAGSKRARCPAKEAATSRAAAKPPNFYRRVWAFVRLVPPGRVTTYGAVAAWLGSPRGARAVGYALAARLPADVPWQRVVNRLGEVSVGGAVWRPEEQRRRLEAEGVAFDAGGRIALATYAFVPSRQQLRRAQVGAATLRV